VKKPGIPAIPPMDPQIADVLNSLKINVEQITGVRGGPIVIMIRLPLWPTDRMLHASEVTPAMPLIR